MKKALIVTTVSGFVPQFEMNNVRLLQNLGYEVHYASNFDHPVYEYDASLFQKAGIRTHHVTIQKSPFGIPGNLKALAQLRRLMARERFDLIHCHNPMGGVLGRLAACISGKGAVMLYTAHGFHFYKGAPWKNWLLYYPVERFLARFTDHLITINREDYERAAGFHLRSGGKVWKIPGVGLDAQRFRPGRSSRQEQKKELGFPSDGFLLLSVGELNTNKNHETVIRALASMKDERLYYGICGRGAEKERLRELTDQLGLAGHVRLLGYRKDIEKVLQAADCFVFPSKREGFGMASVEAMACGIPMITSDCRGTREYMQDGVTGIMCRLNRPESYASAIRWMTGHGKEREQMGAACRNAACRFSREATEEVMRVIYNQADGKE